MKVLHVTESFASGVLSFIDDLTRAQASAGIEPQVLYVVRPDSPTRAQIESRFATGVVLHPAIDSGGPASLLTLYKQLRQLQRTLKFDAIHLHSSRAGVVGRAALSRDHERVFYSPHGFAFLRLNTSPLAQRVIHLIERLFARRGSLIVTSASEEQIARTDLKARSVFHLKSGVPRSAIVDKKTVSGGRPRVITMARMVYQKAPWRFAKVATALSDLADFTWIGGDTAGAAKWMAGSPVEVIEWVTPEDLENLVGSADLMLFPTLWEGFSLALVQAQAAGLPAVTTDVVGNRDAVLDGVTGYVCTTDDELIAATRRLLEDVELRQRMSTAAHERVATHFTNDGMGEDTRAIYTRGANQLLTASGKAP